MPRGRRISRRRFIAQTAGTALGAVSLPLIVSSSALGRAGSVAPSERITLGFLGAGKQSKHLMRSFLNSSGTQVLAACDVDKLKLGRSLKWDPKREVFVGDDDANRLLSRPMQSPWHL